MLKDALGNIKKAVDIEANKPYVNKYSRFVPPPDFVHKHIEREFKQIELLLNAQSASITLTAEEYATIKYWAEWEETTLDEQTC